MEAIGCVDTRQGIASRGYFGVSRHARRPRLAASLAAVPGGLVLVDPRGRGGRLAVLDGAVAAARSLADKAADDVGVLGFEEAVAFASGVEELSRTLDYLQVAAAAGLDRARNDEPVSRQGWTTGWAAGAGWTSGTTAAHADAQAGAPSPGTGSARGGEFRSTAEHLRSLLRIGAAEARRRLALARELLPAALSPGKRSLPGTGKPPRRWRPG
ncbi:hypothetical protein AHiyo8_38340 [Arthrobacter sp. Hiyo8]|nr:hypothetical protein AHiyo8_38340 [Arthrobacter sp. Hiyo8]